MGWLNFVWKIILFVHVNNGRNKLYMKKERTVTLRKEEEMDL